MRGFAPAAVLLAGALCLPAASAAADRPGWIAWPRDGVLDAELAGGFTATLSRAPDEDGLVAPVLTLGRAGARPLRLVGDAGSPRAPADLGAFALDRRSSAPVILVRTYTGGAHCCLRVRLVAFATGRWTVTELGQYDAATAPEPADVDHDGRLELLSADQRFLYRFDAYAGSIAPPVVYELRGRRLIDVSAQPRYRAAFADRLAAYRQDCEAHDFPNGPCAGYVATAARAGRAQEAFDVLDRNAARADFKGPFTVPEHCGGTPRRCRHDRPEKAFDTLHAAVAWFLRDLGYLPGDQS